MLNKYLYPFGSVAKGRSFSSQSYRYGFNGQEKDTESLTQDYGMRIYDPRLGKFLSIDPISKNYAWLSTYQFAANSPLSGIDINGLEYYYSADGTLLGHIGTSKALKVVDEKNVEDVHFALLVVNMKDGHPEGAKYFTEKANLLSTDVKGMDNDELNMRSMLTVMKKHEGGAGKEGYTTWFGGEKFTDTKDHPGANSKGKTAAGAYQIMKASWNDENTGKKFRSKYNIKDFTAQSQDKFSVATIKDKANIKGAYELILKGDFEGAMTKMANEWRFLPGKDTQSKLKTTTLMSEIKTAISNELKGATDLATPQGEVLKDFKK